MSPRWLKITRDVWLHKARTLLALVAISIGLIGAGIVLDAWALVRRATVEQFAASNPAAMTLTLDSVDAPVLAMVRALPTVEHARALRTISANLRGSAAPTSGVVVVVDDVDDRHIGALALESGHWANDDSSIVVELSSRDLLDASIGGSVDVRTASGVAKRFVVSGIARDVGIPPGWMDHFATVFVARQALSRLAAGGQLTQLQVTLKGAPRDVAVVRRAARDISAALTRAGYRVRDTAVPVPGRHPHAAQMDSLMFTQGAFGVLALLLSAFLVANLVGAMLAGQLREIGIMKAIGGRRGQIVALYLVLSAALGIAASVIAIPVAAVGGRLYAQFVAQMLNYDVSRVAIPLWSLMLQALVGIALPVAAAAIPVLRGCSVSVCTALRGGDLAAGVGTRRAPAWLRGDRIPRVVSLSLDILSRRPMRAAMTILTLSVGGAVFLGARSLRTGVIGSVDNLYSAYQFDVALRFVAPHGIDSLEAVARTLSGVGGAEAWLRTSATLHFADGSAGNSFTLTGLPASTVMLRPKIVAGRWLKPGDVRQLVVSRALSNGQPSFALGAVTPLVVNGRTESWTVVGIVEMGIEADAFASRDEIATVLGTHEGTGIVLSASDTNRANRLAFVQRLRDDLRQRGMDVRSAQFADDGREAVQDHLVMVVWFLGAMAQVMVVVGGLGLASTMSISVIERTREIGILRAIGATPRAVQLLVHTEGVCIAVLSWILAIGLSIPIGRGLGVAFSQIMFPVPMSMLPDVRSLADWLLLVVVVAFLASLWPARRASSIEVRDALAYE